MQKPYNYVLKKYLNSYQIKIFKNPIKSSSSSFKDVQEITKKTRSMNGNRFSDVNDQEDQDELTVKEQVENKLRSLKNSINRTKSKIYDIAKSNEWKLFTNITFDSKKIDRYDYDLCVKTTTQWFMNIKNNYDKSLKYLLIPEFHDSEDSQVKCASCGSLYYQGQHDQCPKCNSIDKIYAVHFHGLLGSDNINDLKKALMLTNSGRRSKMGLPIYNMNRFTLGGTELTYVKDTQCVSNYMTKYITKELINNTKYKPRYFRSNNLNDPVVEKVLLSRDDLYQLIKEQEKKALMSDNSYSKTINIQAPGYDNEMSIYNFATSYDQDIIQSIGQYFDNCEISVI